MSSYLFLTLVSTAFAGWWTPEQVALSWTENENEMRVTYVTLSWVPYTNVGYRSILCASTDNEIQYITGEYVKYNAGDDEDHIIYIHTAVMTGLRSECQYEYFVGMTWLWSDTYYFSGLTPDYDKPYEQLDLLTKVLVFGDWGVGPVGEATSKLLQSHSKMRTFDAVLHIGDMAYNIFDENGKRGDRFGREKEFIAANYPYMTLPGNHEDHWNFTAYRHRYLMPENYANNKTSQFYSFNLGKAHYVMMDTELYMHHWPDQQLTQMNWLKADLAQANTERDIRPWLIVLSHHPLYCSVNWREPMDSMLLESNSNCGIDVITMRGALEDVFNENGVDLYFQAHVHNYERDAAIYNNITVPSEKDGPNYHYNANAPVYITSGNAGNYEGHNDPISPTPQLWERFESNSYGYGTLVVYNDTHVYWEYYDSYTTEVIDYLWLEKNRPRYDFTKLA